MRIADPEHRPPARSASARRSTRSRTTRSSCSTPREDRPAGTPASAGCWATRRPSSSRPPPPTSTPPTTARAVRRPRTWPRRPGAGSSPPSAGWSARTAAASGDRSPPPACTMARGACSGSPGDCATCRRARRRRSSFTGKQEALELALEAAGLGTWEHDLSTGDDAMDARARALFGMPADEPVTSSPVARGDPPRRSRAHPGALGARRRRARTHTRPSTASSGRTAASTGSWRVGRCVTDPDDRDAAPVHRRRPRPHGAPPHRGAPAGEPPAGGGRAARRRDRARPQQHARRHPGLQRPALPELRAGRPPGGRTSSRSPARPRGPPISRASCSPSRAAS